MQLRVIQIRSASKITLHQSFDDLVICLAHVGFCRLVQPSSCEEFGIPILSAAVKVDGALQTFQCGSVGDLKKHNAEAEELWITDQVVEWER